MVSNCKNVINWLDRIKVIVMFSIIGHEGTFEDVNTLFLLQGNWNLDGWRNLELKGLECTSKKVYSKMHWGKISCCRY